MKIFEIKWTCLMKKPSLSLSSIVLIFFISTSYSNSFDFGEMMVVSGKVNLKNPKNGERKINEL